MHFLVIEVVGAVIHMLPVERDHCMAVGFTSLTFLVRAGFTSRSKYSVRHRWTRSEAQNRQSLPVRVAFLKVV